MKGSTVAVTLPLALLLGLSIRWVKGDRLPIRLHEDLMQRSIDAHRADSDLIHVLFTVDSENEMDAAVTASMFSVLKNAKDPGSLRFHFVVPQHEDAQGLCRAIMNVALNKLVLENSPEGPASIMGHRNSVPNYLRRRLPFPCMSKRSFGEAACICNSLQFHVIILENDAVLHQKLTRQVSMLEAIAPQMRNAPPAGISKASKTRKRLGNIANFSRNIAPEFLRQLNVDKVIYLDADTIVQTDIAELWRIPFRAGKYVMMSEDCTVSKRNDFNEESPLVQRIYASSGNTQHCHLNSGVLVLDLVGLERLHVGARISHVIREHSRGPMRLWESGWQQPPFVLALYNYIQVLDRSWNLARLGAGFCSKAEGEKNGRFSEAILKSAHILHWSGGRKPWLKNGCFKEFWTPYSVTPWGDAAVLYRMASSGL